MKSFLLERINVRRKMDANIVQYNEKIKQLFGRFLEPEYDIRNDVYFNRLLTHLSGSNRTDNESALMNLPIFSEWIVQAVSIWDSNSMIPSANIASFTLNLAALLSKSEAKFTQLNCNNFYIKLVNVLKARQPEVSPSIKLAYIKLLSSFLQHKSGIEWTIASNFWEDVLKFCLNNQTIYITRAGYQFMADILSQTIDHSEEFCNNVVKRIMAPLGDSHLLAIKAPGMCEVSDELIHKNLSPTLQLIGNILEHFLESSLFAQKDFRIVLIFLKNFHLEQRICNFMMIAQNKYLVFDLGKIMCIMQFLELYVQVVTNQLKPADVLTAVRKIMSIFSTNISRGNFENVMKFCYFGQFYWFLVGYKIPVNLKTEENETKSFANQLIVLQMLPVFCISMKYCTDSVLELEKRDCFREAYVSKIFKMMCQHTVRIAYNWRDFLLVQPNLFEIGKKTILYIMKSRKYYPRERAAMAFQSLIYSLKDILVSIKEHPEQLEVFSRESVYMGLLLDTIGVFVEEFDITWRDSVETICLLSVTFDFLGLPTWDSKLVVKALKVMNISISKYMSPNMALLIDRTADSTMALVGPLLYAKLHDSTWEVRDSALEVVCTISLFSHKKFPSMQKVLLESELPELVVKMCTSDGEAFVRATAIKCLQAMIEIDDIWESQLKQQNLPDKIRSILLNETEGIVRVEAATFMQIAYESRQFPAEVSDDIYETMIHSATADLHWEVKVRALTFWEAVINYNLQMEGMIDGKFPEVTFSRENRKIVCLNHGEIKKRLQKVLNRLSAIGCLGLLITAIQDDCDMEVSKTAARITQSFVGLLKTHNITQGDLSTPSSPVPETHMCNSTSSGISSICPMDDYQNSPMSINQETTEEIIDQIVNAKDISLLNGVYAPSDYGSVLEFDLRVKKIVSVNDFLQFTRQDLDHVINEKRNWLNGIEDLGSLLDDMLKSYTDDVNNMDCY